MMTRKTRKLVGIVVAIVTLVVITIVTMGILYIKTDLFKSSKVLFAKYMSNAIGQTVELTDMQKEKEYESLKELNNYESNTRISGSYTKNYNTISEDSTDLINNLEVVIDEKNSADEDKNYKNIKLANNSEQVSQIELYRQEQTYGIRFSDLFAQILSIENSNLKQLAENLGMDSSNIPDSIETNNNYMNMFEFSDEEIETLKTNYMDTIFSAISKDKFSKQKGTVITVNNKSITTNAYILTLTQEEINNIYISILQKLESDEIILNKISNIDTLIYEEYPNSEYENYVKDNFIQYLEDEIQNIKDNNIGQNQIKITIYEENGQTIRIKQETDEKNILIDFTKTDTTNEIKYQTSEVENENNGVQLKVSKESSDVDSKFSIYFSTQIEDTKQEIEISRTITNVNDNSTTTNTVLSYYNGTDKLGLNIDKTLNIIASVEFTEENTENNIVLNQLDKDTLTSLLGQVQTAISNYSSEPVNKLKQDYEGSILNFNNLFNSTVQIEDNNEMSSVDKNRFNSQFEFYAGEDLDYETVEELLSVVSKNLKSFDVISNNQIKLNIEQEKENQEAVNSILGVLSKDKKYSIVVNYDTNNIVNNIVLTIL